ncbi:hypothetical protein BJV74DRAFT_920534 [Russula compacta]|nr:hypothetical protein BJV74DRAFT_920534 [Russula compacta]
MMRLRLTTVFIILPVISVHTIAFSWRRHDSSKLFPDLEHPVPQDIAIHDIGLNDDAIDSVTSPYMRKPDCFRRAAGRIRIKCAEIDMDADQRVKAAISMTLCELQTAEFHSIPLECEVFLEEGGLDGRTPHGICVERVHYRALSRSTQSWASYSGYLREIPQLCFAYQRSNEKDLALEIYRNATIEKIAYLRHLMQRAEKEDEARTLWESLLSVRLTAFYSGCSPSISNSHRTSKAPLTASRCPQDLSTRSISISQPEFFMNCNRSFARRCHPSSTSMSKLKHVHR